MRKREWDIDEHTLQSAEVVEGEANLSEAVQAVSTLYQAEYSSVKPRSKTREDIAYIWDQVEQQQARSPYVGKIKEIRTALAQSYRVQEDYFDIPEKILAAKVTGARRIAKSTVAQTLFRDLAISRAIKTDGTFDHGFDLAEEASIMQGQLSHDRFVNPGISVEGIVRASLTGHLAIGPRKKPQGRIVKGR